MKRRNATHAAHDFKMATISRTREVVGNASDRVKQLMRPCLNEASRICTLLSSISVAAIEVTRASFTSSAVAFWKMKSNVAGSGGIGAGNDSTYGVKTLMTMMLVINRRTPLDRRQSVKTDSDSGNITNQVQQPATPDHRPLSAKSASLRINQTPENSETDEDRDAKPRDDALAVLEIWDQGRRRGGPREPVTRRNPAWPGKLKFCQFCQILRTKQSVNDKTAASCVVTQIVIESTADVVTLTPLAHVERAHQRSIAVAHQTPPWISNSSFEDSKSSRFLYC